MKKRAGTIYLLHFERPYGHARHYLGFTDNLEQRLERHRSGDGARLLAVIKAAGIRWVLARTWKGDRTIERRLKTTGSSTRLCPICSPEGQWGGFAPSQSHVAVERRQAGAA